MKLPRYDEQKCSLKINAFVVVVVVVIVVGGGGGGGGVIEPERFFMRNIAIHKAAPARAASAPASVACSSGDDSNMFFLRWARHREGARCLRG